MQEIIFKIRYFERALSKPLKLTFFFFRIQSLLMDKVIKNKRGLELWPVSLQVRKQVQKNLFISYLLSDQVWWCNTKRFFSYSKTYTCKFMQPNSWHHKLFHFYLLCWIWNVWKGRGKITKSWISQERKDLFRWNKKTFFKVFEGLSFGEKIKFW